MGKTGSRYSSGLSSLFSRRSLPNGDCGEKRGDLSRGAQLLHRELESLLQQQPMLLAAMGQYQRPIRAALTATSDQDVRTWLTMAITRCQSALDELNEP